MSSLTNKSQLKKDAFQVCLGKNALLRHAQFFPQKQEPNRKAGLVESCHDFNETCPRRSSRFSIYASPNSLEAYFFLHLSLQPFLLKTPTNLAYFP